MRHLFSCFSYNTENAEESEGQTMRRFRKVRHVPLPLLAVIMAAILFAELARCEREGAKETAAEAEKSVPRRAALTFDDGPNACYTPDACIPLVPRPVI